jgi:predicted RNA methylase
MCTKPKSISLFSGAGGMDIGVIQAGFNVLASIEMDPNCCETLRSATKRKSLLTVDGKTVIADMKGKEKTFNAFWEDADIAVIDDAYRRAAPLGLVLAHGHDVSIHARTRGCERRALVPTQSGEFLFQSTLAPEGASD